MDYTKLKAKPEEEDFGHKYTKEGRGYIGSMLITNYFNAVRELMDVSGKLKVTSPLSALEIGCGEGYSTQKIQAMLPPGVQFYASEFVGDLVIKARRLNRKVNIIQESAYELTHSDSSFDIVFLLEVLEHLDYPDKALGEIHRVLKQKGILILGVPNEPLWRFLNIARGKYLKAFGNTVGHLNHWSTKSLVSFIESNFGPVIAKRTPLPWTIVLAQRP